MRPEDAVDAVLQLLQLPRPDRPDNLEDPWTFGLLVQLFLGVGTDPGRMLKASIG